MSVALIFDGKVRNFGECCKKKEKGDFCRALSPFPANLNGWTNYDFFSR